MAGTIGNIAFARWYGSIWRSLGPRAELAAPALAPAPIPYRALAPRQRAARAGVTDKFTAVSRRVAASRL
jgi:hypothetical protein